MNPDDKEIQYWKVLHMGKMEIRQPKQARSIAKKNQIIEAGFALFCEKGFHNTNTNEIAKKAGVSTGILYHYFPNKKAILLAAMETQFSKFEIETLQAYFIEGKGGFPTLLAKMIDDFVQFHWLTKAAHEELQAMQHSDPEVAAFIHHFVDSLLTKLANALPSFGISITNAYEKVDIAYNLLEHFCDSVIISRRDSLHYDTMKTIIIEMITSLMKEPSDYSTV